MAEQYTNIRVILDKITRHPLMRDLNLETVIDYTIDFMRIVGVPNMFIEKTEIIEIETYRGLLPSDYYFMIQVRSNTDRPYFYKYASDTFHYSEVNKNSVDATYKIQGDVIYTSTKNTPLEISYSAFNVDECGYPLIPDNSSFFRALEAYIKKNHFTVLFDMGKISNAVMANAQRDYAWAVGDCQSEFNRLSIDKMESFCNSWRTLIVRAHQHSQGFNSDSSRERLIQL